MKVERKKKKVQKEQRKQEEAEREEKQAEQAKEEALMKELEENQRKEKEEARRKQEMEVEHNRKEVQKEQRKQEEAEREEKRAKQAKEEALIKELEEKQRKEKEAKAEEERVQKTDEEGRQRHEAEAKKEDMARSSKQEQDEKDLRKIERRRSIARSYLERAMQSPDVEELRNAIADGKAANLTSDELNGPEVALHEALRQGKTENAWRVPSMPPAYSMAALIIILVALIIEGLRRGCARRALALEEKAAAYATDWGHMHSPFVGRVAKNTQGGKATARPSKLNTRHSMVGDLQQAGRINS